MKKFVLFILLIAAMVCLCSCVDEGSKNYGKHSRLEKIENKKDLYYYKDTGIIYIVFNEFSGYTGYGYMSPYYSENGNLCRYDVTEDKIIEIKCGGS